MNWNCRARAGASQHHGHSHMLLAENFHYGQWEGLRRAAKLYSLENPGFNYFDDLVSAHRNLGLAKTFGEACVFAHLVPFCGYEFKVVSWNYDDNFKLAISEAVKALIHTFGSECFNLCIHFPPLQNGKLRESATVAEIKNRSLETSDIAMPFMAHLVDRGGVTSSSSDVCGMRIYGSAIVNEDPFSIAQQLGWQTWTYLMLLISVFSNVSIRYWCISQSFIVYIVLFSVKWTSKLINSPAICRPQVWGTAISKGRVLVRNSEKNPYDSPRYCFVGWLEMFIPKYQQYNVKQRINWHWLFSAWYPKRTERYPQSPQCGYEHPKRYQICFFIH